MKEKSILSILLLLFTTTAIIASPRSRQQAFFIADSVAHSHNLQVLKTGPAKAKAKTIASNSCSYYVFNNTGSKGFTIVSGEDQLPAVVGYTTEGSFDTDNMPDALMEFLDSYNDMVTKLSAKDVTATKIANQAQARLNSTITAIAPLVSTKWNQDAPYNIMCPKYDASNTSATGCVATAMAQILYYYGSKKSFSLTTDIPSYTSEDYSIPVPVISAATDGTYDWTNMLTDYSSYNDEQANAVAKLMYHCGASVQMNYGPSSGASDNATQNAFVTYFGMDKELCVLVSRDNYPYKDWVQLINNELENSRPIFYTGSTPEREGHAFVCDGRDAKGYYHINWGWGGAYDGFFDITVLRPSGQGIGGSRTQDASFAGENSMIIGITPDNGITDTPLVKEKLTLISYSTYTPTLTITKDTRSSAAETFEGNVQVVIGNINSSSVTRNICLGIQNEDGTFTPISNSQSVALDKMSGSSYHLTYFPLSFSYAIPVSTKRIYIIESADNGATWTACYGADDFPFGIDVTATTLTKQTGNFTATVHAPTPTGSTKNQVVIKLHNNSPVEYHGAFYVQENTTNAQPGSYYYSDNIYIPAGETKTVSISSYDTSADKKYYFIADKNWSVIGTGESGTLGDINKTGSISTDDVKAISNVITSNTSVPGIDEDAADVNGDNKVDIIDVVKLIDKIKK